MSTEKDLLLLEKFSLGKNNGFFHSSIIQLQNIYMEIGFHPTNGRNISVV